MAPSEISTLETSVLPSAMQLEVLSFLVRDRETMVRFIESITERNFENPVHRVIYNIARRYFLAYLRPPPRRILERELDRWIHANEDSQVVGPDYFWTEVDRLYNIPLTERQYLLDKVTDFLVRYECGKLGEQAIQAVRVDTFNADSVMRAITAFISVQSGQMKSRMEYLLKDAETRVREEPTAHRISTGLRTLDKVLGGGLDVGELGIVLGPTGMGKSHLLITFGSHGMQQRHRVLHVTLELSKEKVLGRYEAFHTRIPKAELFDKMDDVVRHLTRMRSLVQPADVLVIEYPTRGLTVDEFRAAVSQAAVGQSFIPDLIILDYADILRPSKEERSEKRYEVLMAMYERLRGLAQEFHVPIWTGCLRGNVEVALPEGNVPIGELEGKRDFWIWAWDIPMNKPKVAKASKCVKTGTNVSLVRVGFDDGSHVECTEDHKFLLRDGYKEARHLQEGDSCRIIVRDEYKHRRSIYNRLRIKRKWISEHRFVWEQIHGRKVRKTEAIHHKDFNPKNNHPENLVCMLGKRHQRFHKELADGLFNAGRSERNKKMLSELRRVDNPMWKSGVKEKMIRSKLKFYEGLTKEQRQRMCSNRTTLRKGGSNPYDLVVVREKTSKTVKNQWASMTAEEKSKKLRGVRGCWGRVRKRDRSTGRFVSQNHKVLYVRRIGRGNVYDIEVPETSNFILGNRVVVHNSQARRTALGKKVITIADIGESFGKAQVADVVLCICKTKTEEEMNCGRFYVGKNRDNPGHIVIPFRQDLDYSRFSEPADAHAQEMAPSEVEYDVARYEQKPDDDEQVPF